MKKLRKKLVRKHSIFAVYQYLLLDKSKENITNYISSNLDISKDSDEMVMLIDIISGVIQKINNLNNTIEPFLNENWSLKKINKIDHAILLVSTYEMNYMDIDKHIVINEAVNIAKEYSDDDSYKYINAILNKVHD